MRFKLVRRVTMVALLFLVLMPELSSTANGQQIGPISSMPLPTIGYAPKIVPVSGVVRVLVIAVAFSDINYTMGIDRIKQVWFGTVPAYYHEISFGKLTIQGDVYGWYKLPYPEVHYGRDCHAINDADCSGSNQSWHIAEDAALLAQKNVNFKNYDYYVFIHSGRGQETSHVKNDVWSVTYLDANIRTSSKTLSRFNIVPELEEPPYVPNGVWVLEFGHNLGVPDLYNIANGPDNGKPILGPWELMDKGSWNGDPPGALPAHMTAWPKIQLGFINGSMLAMAYPGTTSTFTVDPTEVVSSNVHAIKIPFTTNSNPKQYYLVEVRTKTGFDSGLPAAGVLITYVNETRTIGPVHVMDGDPGVSNLEDAVWNVGQTFYDNTHNLAVKVVGKVVNSYTVTVTSSSQHSIPTDPPHGITLQVTNQNPLRMGHDVSEPLGSSQGYARSVTEEDESSSQPYLMRCHKACIHF